jgi:hypothetical protein
LEEKRQSVPDAGYARVFWGIGINCRAFEDFCREDTNYLPSKSLSRPGLPSLPSLERIVNRIVHGDIARNRTAKKSGNLVKPGLDNENSGHNSGEPGPQPGIQYSKIDNREFIPEDKYLSIKEELDEINLGQKEHEEHFKTPISRNLSEDGEWEDCEYCGLPLPPSWQNERNGFIFCADCLKIYNHNGVEDNGN